MRADRPSHRMWTAREEELISAGEMEFCKENPLTCLNGAQISGIRTVVGRSIVRQGVNDVQRVADGARKPV